MQHEEHHAELLSKMGNRIRTLRKAQGLSQTKLAQKLGQNNPNTISIVENGKRMMSLRALLKIASVLGVPPGALLDGGNITVTHRVNL